MNEQINSSFNACQHREHCRLVEQQRDELLAVLERIAQYPGSRHQELGYAGARELARKAIAKAKEGAR